MMTFLWMMTHCGLKCVKHFWVTTHSSLNAQLTVLCSHVFDYRHTLHWQVVHSTSTSAWPSGGCYTSSRPVNLRRPACVAVDVMSKYIGILDVSWLLLKGSFNFKSHKMRVNVAVMGLGPAKLLSSDALSFSEYILRICVLYAKLGYNAHDQKGS